MFVILDCHVHRLCETLPGVDVQADGVAVRPDPGGRLLAVAGRATGRCREHNRLPHPVQLSSPFRSPHRTNPLIIRNQKQITSNQIL
ncbi:hypothetical protein LSTR_LSTR002214 [Laodelphax striatellus]|uniref:Uncharacterized protein n=1 Tax=Laodelphax striatellus TaxID=195883 RepID=A0A482XGH3_LAOST|nr:hypothetical protein LSTR_LSTR002214 [Laodelphax striatellus]